MLGTQQLILLNNTESKNIRKCNATFDIFAICYKAFVTIHYIKCNEATCQKTERKYKYIFIIT